MPYTITLHRILRAPAERVYRAFLEADALVKWMAPNGFTATVHALDAKVGGGFRMSFRNFTSGQAHSFSGRYLELHPHERLRYTDSFDDPALPGEIAVVVALKGGLDRDGADSDAERASGCHPARGLLSRLAGITGAAGRACGG